MLELATYFAAQRQERLAIIYRLQKSIIRVLKAEHLERSQTAEEKIKNDQLLYEILQTEEYKSNFKSPVKREKPQ